MAIDPQESESIDREDDLVQLHPQTRYLGRNILASILFGNRYIPRGIPWVQNWFSGKVPGGAISLKTEDPVWPDNQKLGRGSTFIVSVVGPVWALAYLEPTAYWLAVISVFMMLFFYRSCPLELKVD
jgi:hypothetical protein